MVAAWKADGPERGAQVRLLYLPPIRSLSSPVERYIDIVEVVGASPTGITNLEG